MRINILVGGEAGQGINFIANFISRVLARSGFYVFNYRNYSSLIKGGHNFNIICVSEKPVHSFDESFDAVLDIDGKTPDLHRDKIKKKAFVISCNKSYEKEFENFLFVDSKFKKLANMFFACCLLRMFGISREEVEKEVKNFVKTKLRENLEVVRECFDRFDLNFKFKLKKGKAKEVVDGSEAVARAVVDARTDIYLGYPMTPATSVLTYLAQKQKENNIFVFSPENEIAVVNAALGASFAGARVAVGTSGGGFDLMSEGLSMQGMTELPLVVYLAMRAGPSTGVPTYTTQADLNVALYAGHGEFPRIVFTPGDADEAYELTKKAFEISEKYGVLSIILSDKHLAESSYIFDAKQEKLNPRKTKLGRIVYKANSYEHTKEGYDSEDADVVMEGNERRIAKIEKIKRDVENFSYKVYGNKKSKNILISFGSTKGAVIDALSLLKNFKFIHVKVVEPFSEKLIKEIKEAENIFVIEANVTSQLSDVITRNTGVVIDNTNKILKYDARPFTPSFIIEELKNKIGKNKTRSLK